jgi:hypothetical protein
MNNPEGKKTTIHHYLALTLNPTFWLYGARPPPLVLLVLPLPENGFDEVIISVRLPTNGPNELECLSLASLSSQV